MTWDQADADVDDAHDSAEPAVALARDHAPPDAGAGAAAGQTDGGGAFQLAIEFHRPAKMFSIGCRRITTDLRADLFVAIGSPLPL